jgi:hypothetical protein
MKSTSLLSVVAIWCFGAEAQAYNCGPHLYTYQVRSLANTPGNGVRCVKFGEGHPGNMLPAFAWTGEGRWQGSSYRHVGHAYGEPDGGLVGYASDISGNGEAFSNNFNGNLQISTSGGPIPATIRVQGAWNEEWALVRGANYVPIVPALIKRCGPYFHQFTVNDLGGDRQGRGIRCMLQVGPQPNVTWFGQGTWSGATYSHLGTMAHNGYGASDVCDGRFAICNVFPWGSLSFTPNFLGGFDVTGSWNERWK